MLGAKGPEMDSHRAHRWPQHMAREMREVSWAAPGKQGRGGRGQGGAPELRCKLNPHSLAKVDERGERGRVTQVDGLPSVKAWG